MRLATLNLLNGRSLADGLVDTERLRAQVALLDADVLGLQEVDCGQARSHGTDQTAEVAAATGAVDARFVPALAGTPGGAWEPAAGDEAEVPSYGVGLVSRVAVRRWHVLRLPATPLVVPVPVPGAKRLLWLKDEPRVVLAAELDGLTVATTHLSFVPGWNVVQLRRVRRWLAGLSGPHVLLGDLNLTPGLARRATGWSSLVSAATFPGPAPRLQLDHVLASCPLSVTGARAHLLTVSDHRALTVDLALPVPAQGG
ncbi:MAG: endonuclease/exonuclease/phosphatase family protein [Oryzihumus sp.]